MKKIILWLVILLLCCTACGKAVQQTEESMVSEAESGSGAEPAAEFETAEAAIEKIKETKAAGMDETLTPKDRGYYEYKLYDKDHLYILKDSPLNGFEQESIILNVEGLAIRYRKDKESAIFYWFRGYETEEKVEERIHRFNLKHCGNTKFFIGGTQSNICILWWDHGDEFMFSYPADSNIAPKEVIEHIEVEKADC